MERIRAPKIGLQSAMAVPMALALASALAVSGCAKQAFVAGALQGRHSPGYYEIPAKIDLVLAEDDTGSMSEIYDDIAAQTPAFLTELDAAGWDYHFVTTPLTQLRDLNQLQVLTSKYDGNYDSTGEFLSPYPGAEPSDPGVSINPLFFERFGDYSQFVQFAEINNTLNQYEPGFDTINNFLNAAQVKTTSKFMRPDAMLAVVVVGNGNDTSNVSFYDRGDGLLVPNPASEAASFTAYKNSFLNLVTTGKTSRFRFYAAVANLRYQNCYGGISQNGYRYRQMASETGGASFDICTQSVSAVLAQLKTVLTNERLAYRMRYLVLESEPRPETIKVTRYPNGNTAAAVAIPQDAVNGWTYVGLKTDEFVIDSPVMMSKQTGYMIQLNGTARLLGDDAANVEYVPLNSFDSATP